MNVPFNLRAIQTEQFVSDGSYARLLCPAYQWSGLWNSKAAQSTCRRNHTKKEAQLEGLLAFVILSSQDGSYITKE